MEESLSNTTVIRGFYDKKCGKDYIVITDLIRMLTKSNSLKLWKKIKKDLRLSKDIITYKENNKSYDSINISDTIRVIMYISSKRAEYIRNNILEDSISKLYDFLINNGEITFFNKTI